MPRYQLLERAVIDGELMEAGRELEFDGVPGKHMEPLDKEGEAALRAVKDAVPVDLSPNMTGFFGFGATLAPPINVDPPVITADSKAVPIKSISCTSGDWLGDPTDYSYQWLSDGVEVEGTDDVYNPAVSDMGNDISCVVTATNAAGSTEAVSNTVSIPDPPLAAEGRGRSTKDD